MTAHDKASSLPAPISLTLEEAAQVSGGANFVLEKYLLIGRPVELALLNAGGGMQTLPGKELGGLAVGGMAV